VYRGKQDIEAISNASLREILLRLQSGLNFALANERAVPEHRDHPRFHVDYVRSEHVNALAFRHEDYSFVGLTIPLIEVAMQLGGRVGPSADLLSSLCLELTQEVAEGLGILLFRIIIFFVVSHEYTHIVHGHRLSQTDGSAPPNEVEADDRIGSLGEQTLEADADSYATYHIMGNWIGGVKRSEGVSLLKIDSVSADAQDDVLLACVIVAIGAFFFLRPVPQLDARNVYELTHPPQPVRLNSLMETVIGWCRQNRPGLEDRMLPERFNSLLSIVAGVVWEFDETKQQNWKSQVEFLRSAYGSEYVAKLMKSKNEYRAAL